MKQITIILILTLLLQTVNGQITNGQLAVTDSTINHILKEWNVPGLTLAVVEKGKVLYTKGYGYKDYENKILVTENTLFPIASCTKAFTASLLSSLLKEDKIGLDKPVNDYIPELQFYNNELTRNITIRDMLCHRTGLPRHDGAWISNGISGKDNLLKAIKYFEPSAPLRQSFQYNNLMYMCLGLLAEKVTKKPWEELIKQELFTPLGMTNSIASVSASTYKNCKDLALGYGEKDGRIVSMKYFTDDNNLFGPAGAIASSAKDMANWLLLWVNGGKFNNKEIITPSFYNEAISSQMVASSYLPEKDQRDMFFLNYALGWYTTSYRGHYGVGHGGNLNGFSAYTIFFPSDSIGIFVCANQNNAVVPEIIAKMLSDQLLKLSFRDWNKINRDRYNKLKAGNDSASATEQTEKDQISKPTHLLNDYAGIYKNEAYGTIVITKENDNLKAKVNDWNLKMGHLNYDNFRFEIREDFFENSVNGYFSIDRRGDIKSLLISLEEGVKDIEFKKQITVGTINKERLKKYTGAYDVQGAILQIFFADNGKFTARLPGQPDYELIATQADNFGVKGLDGFYIQFNADEKAKIISAIITQPNGKVTARKINGDLKN